jgi:hypothetical protein
LQIIVLTVEQKMNSSRWVPLLKKQKSTYRVPTRMKMLTNKSLPMEVPLLIEMTLAFLLSQFFANYQFEPRPNLADRADFDIDEPKRQSIIPTLNDRLVHVTGTATTEQTLSDPDFG